MPLWKNMDEDPLDKLSDKMLKPQKCTADPNCKYRPKSFTDYVKHLNEKHPDGGKATGW